MSMQGVDTLSDDGLQPSVQSEPGPQPVVAIGQRRPAKRRVPSIVAVPRVDGKLLRHRVEGNCGCLCQCFVPFRILDAFEKLLKVRKTLAGLGKLEQDEYA